MTNISGGVAVITGAASGIGACLAAEFAARGATLALADIDVEGLARVRDAVSEHGNTCTLHTVDVGNREAIQAFAADVEGQHGRASLLINNAGVSLISSAEDTSYADFEWLMQINFWGVVNSCSAFLPMLRREREAHIVNLSSLFGLVSVPLQSAYNASKFAVRGYTEALRMELERSPIRVTCVHPGGVRTPIARHARVGDGIAGAKHDRLADLFEARAMTTPEQAALLIARAVEKNRERLLVGADARLVDKIARLLPTRYDRVLGLRKLLGN
ncbi:MAG: SDR family NAD(P)-dependent oxidoreductase [Pseudomonadota bacterium]